MVKEWLRERREGGRKEKKNEVQWRNGGDDRKGREREMEERRRG